MNPNKIVKPGNSFLSSKFCLFYNLPQHFERMITLFWPGRKLGNRGNHGNHGNSSCTRELQILPIKNKERQTQKRI